MTGKCGHVQGSEPKSHKPAQDRVSLSSPRRSSNFRSNIIGEIKSRLGAAQIEMLCREWLPDGKRQGGWYVAKNPWRNDNNPSLGVSFTTGKWRDFATGESGDMIDLSMRIFGDSLQDTLVGFAEMLGIQS